MHLNAKFAINWHPHSYTLIIFNIIIAQWVMQQEYSRRKVNPDRQSKNKKYAYIRLDQNTAISMQTVEIFKVESMELEKKAIKIILQKYMGDC